MRHPPIYIVQLETQMGLVYASLGLMGLIDYLNIDIEVSHLNLLIILTLHILSLWSQLDLVSLDDTFHRVRFAKE